MKLKVQLKDINKKNLFCKTEWITGKIIKIETLNKKSLKN
jgi:putative aminomethyltransferase